MKRISLILLIAVGFLASCSKDYLETSPTNKISDKSVFNTVQGCQTVLDGIFNKMTAYRTSHDDFGVKAFDLAMDMMGEDIVPSRHHWFGFDYRHDNRGSTYRRTLQIWRTFYEIIYNVNSILANIDAASTTTQAEKDYVKGQALALRGYCYHNLAQWYSFTYPGHENDLCVPLVIEPTTVGLPRSTVQQVYTQINKDLDDAIALLTSANAPRRHVSDLTLNVAHGLRARVALEMRDYNAAKTHADAARAGYNLNTSAQFAAGFDNYQNQVWLWGMELNDEQSTIYASFFSHLDMTIGGYAGLGYSPKFVNPDLFNGLSDNDIRKQLMVPRVVGGLTSYVNYKFNAGAGKEFAADYVLMRPEEMLLISAEANARLGGANETTAQSLIKELWDARITPAVAAPTQTGQALIDLILFERRVELWGEGFRFRDLKRLKLPLQRNPTVGSVRGHTPSVAVVMSLNAESPEYRHKLPQAEIDNNNAIDEADQNP